MEVVELSERLPEIRSPLSDAERRRIARAYGVKGSMPGHVRKVRAGVSGVSVMTTQEQNRAAIKRSIWGGRCGGKDPAKAAERRRKALALAENGLAPKQIAHALKMSQQQVYVDLRRARAEAGQ